MSDRTTRQSRRRRNKPSRTPFYLGLGLLAIIGLMFVLINVLKDKPAPTTTPVAGSSNSIPMTEITASIGQTPAGNWYKGEPNAPFKLEIFSDYQCPYCANLETDLATNKFDEKYVNTGKVQVIYHEYPLPQHQWAKLTAEAARCSGDQNKFWQAHNAIFGSQGSWANMNGASGRNFILDQIANAGVNKDTLVQCVDAGTHKDGVNASMNDAIQRQVNQTPTVFLNGVEVDGSFAVIIQAIEANDGK